jgi:hypothetical protein
MLCETSEHREKVCVLQFVNLSVRLCNISHHLNVVETNYASQIFDFISLEPLETFDGIS